MKTLLILIVILLQLYLGNWLGSWEISLGHAGPGDESVPRSASHRPLAGTACSIADGADGGAVLRPQESPDEPVALDNPGDERNGWQKRGCLEPVFVPFDAMAQRGLTPGSLPSPSLPAKRFTPSLPRAPPLA